MRTYTHPDVLAAAQRGESWADPITDPTQIDWKPRQAAAAIPFEVVDGRPLNPAAPTGIRYGRNELGHWGEQLCGDAAVTVTDENGKLWLAVIERGDGHGWALPGGTAEPGESGEDTAIREFAEETTARVPSDAPRTVWPARVVPDPRASDEAWMTTVLVHVYLGTMRRADFPSLEGADDARRAQWVLADNYSVLTSYLADAYHGKVFPAHEGVLAELLG
ncbi:NUDIX domain-containing protein [Nonomuraea sp. NPDC023979]|uniref:NUDIX domain-containing protein n=1 Tax=Nonomuraea sp. NPDC023979 TaxID=3154796 RepID=UPI0033FE58BC